MDDEVRFAAGLYRGSAASYVRYGDAGLAAAPAPFGDRGTFTETVSFACELARKAASLTGG